MKTNLFTLFLCLLLNGVVLAQTTATDFTTNDCSGTSHQLFTELDNGNVIVISWVMPCASCATYSLPAYSAVQSFATTHPGRVHFYLVDDYANTACGSLTSWANSNNMPLSTTFSSSQIDMSDYGLDGMPKVVVLGKSNHQIFYNQNDDKINFLGVKAAIDAALATTGITDNMLNTTNFKVFPTSAAQQVNVSFSLEKPEIISFEVFDLLGKMVLQSASEMYLPGDQLKAINISALQNGVYMLKLVSQYSSQPEIFTVNQ